MNTNVEKAKRDIDQIDALMYAIENAYLDFDVSDDQKELQERAINSFYALWNAVGIVKEDILRVSDDISVVDAIYAVNRCKSLMQ